MSAQAAIAALHWSEPLHAPPQDVTVDGLPDDYNELVRRTGPFSVDRFLLVYAAAPGSGYDQAQHEASFLSAARESRDQRGFETPYPLPPEAGGLRLWGSTVDGDELLWLPESAGQAGRVIVHNLRDGWWFDSQLPVTDFLIQLLSGELWIPEFPDDYPLGDGGKAMQLA